MHYPLCYGELVRILAAVFITQRSAQKRDAAAGPSAERVAAGFAGTRGRAALADAKGAPVPLHRATVSALWPGANCAREIVPSLAK